MNIFCLSSRRNTYAHGKIVINQTINMKEVPKIIAEVKPQLDELANKYKVDKLYVFGSAVNEQFGDQSDIDFLVSFQEVPLLAFADNYFDLQEELERLFQRRIDLVVEKSIQNPYLAASINKTKVPVYG